jgi:hypothetical protein
MEFLFQNKKHNFPSSTSDITLGQRIEFANLYEKDILQKQKEIQSSEIVDEIDLTENFLDMACKSFAYFASIDLDDALKIPINQILNVYDNCLKLILTEQEEVELTNEFVWKNEVWVLGNTNLGYESEMTFNEFLSSKQIVKSMFDLGNGHWDALPYLCTIYLRKENEEFQESWMIEGSERIELMKSLPLDIALQVGFFLKSSMSMFLQTFQSLEAVQEEKE